MPATQVAARPAEATGHAASVAEISPATGAVTGSESGARRSELRRADSLAAPVQGLHQGMGADVALSVDSETKDATDTPDPAALHDHAGSRRTADAPALAQRPVAQPIPTLAGQLVQAVGADGGATGSYDIALAPEELGRVRLSLHHGEHGLSVVVVADRAETADLIRRHLPDLDRDFRALGHGSVAFSFGDPSGGRRERGPVPGHPMPRAGEDSPVAAVAQRKVASRGLDIRL